MIGKFFSVPETAAAIDIRDGRIHYLVIDRSGRIIKERVADSSDVPAFVAKYGLLNIVVSTSPNETEVLSKYVDSALCAGKSHDDLINEHLPKVIEPDSVTLETVELGSVTLLNFMHNKSEETLYKLLTDSGLLVDRIGGGTCEMGIALQKHFAGFTGAFLLVEKERTFIAVYVNGELCESDELPYGEKLFLENETQYLEEMFKFLICFWENKLLREPVSELIIAGNKEIKEAFQKNGFNVVEKELPFNAVNGFVYAQALNTLEHGKTAVNHNLLVNNKVKQVRLINKAEMLIRHKFIPVGVAAAILLLLVYGAFQLVLSKREQQLGSGSSEYKLLTSIKSQNELYKQQLHDAKKLIKATTERARILGNLAVSTPDNVRLTLLVIEPKSDSLVIEGLSRNSSEIENFYSNLEKTFKDVRLLYSEQSDTKDKLVRFSLSMRAE